MNRIFFISLLLCRGMLLYPRNQCPPIKTTKICWLTLVFFGLSACAYSPPSVKRGPPPEIEVERAPAPILIESGAIKPGPLQQNSQASPQASKESILRVYDADSDTRYEQVDERTVRIIRQPAAVTSLLAAADKLVLQENYVVAAAQVERALRVDPKSSAAYQKLSEIRFQEGKLGVAEQLAKRALSLVPKKGTEAITRQKELWFLLAEIRSAQGDDYGAEHARKKAKSFW